MGGGYSQHVACIDIQDRQPNGMALGMDHLDAADQLGPVAAGPDRNQLARSEVHVATVVQTLKLAIAWCPGPFGLLPLPLMTVMRKASKTLLGLAGLFLAGLGSLSQAATAATVLSIGDGDTISVLERGQKLKVRLACIDAPETAQSPYGMASRNQLKALLPLGSTVSLRVQAVDRYGRSVAEVIGKGIVNLAMVQSGQAFVYRQYLGRCDRGAYLAAERQAQSQRLGVWAVPGGMTRPWDFRHGETGRRSAGAVRAAGPSSAPATSPQAPQPSGAKTTCKQIGSFSRAQELLRQGHSYLDRNDDGVACEGLR